MHSSDSIDDGYLGSGVLILKAIKKYGKANFKREMLSIVATLSEANINEAKYITEYGTSIPFGYNVSPTGGLGCKGCHSKEAREKMIGNKNAKGTIPSEETREKIRQSKIGNTWGFQKGHKSNVGKKLSEETKLKMSENRRGENNGYFGKHHSEETKAKMKRNHADVSGINNPNYKDGKRCANKSEV